MTVVAGLAPLAYYWGLSRWDPSWGIARALNLREAAVWWRALLVAAVPLGLPALLALRIRPATFQDLALRVWPVMALGLYVLIAVGKVGTYPLHALQGLAIPLAVLAVIGVAGVPWRAGRPVAAVLAVAALALLVVPGTVNELRRSLRDADTARIPFFNTRGEEDALAALARDPRPGGVLGPLRIGYQVPSRMRRRVWLGGGSWTPDWFRRIALGEALFGGALPPAQARALVRSTGARFLISDCRGRADLSEPLRPLVQSVRRFGCATVYVLRPG